MFCPWQVLQPRLMFAGKAKNICGAPHSGCLRPYSQTLAKARKAQQDKHSGVFGPFVNCDQCYYITSSPGYSIDWFGIDWQLGLEYRYLIVQLARIISA